MFYKKLLTIIPLITSVINGQYFKTNTEIFLHNVNDEWVDFGKFAAVNLGVTKPGYFPGDVILRREDYLKRFERLDKLGTKVVRVYALLHPEFYQTLLEWNENHEHKIYVLHGCAFPEYQMEGLDDAGQGEGEGADVYNESSHINSTMIDFIERTVRGVYGDGEVIYRDRDGKTGIYTTNIAEYLLGWVISGEVPPTCINKTNNMIDFTERKSQIYKGTYVSATDVASPFESWVAEMLDYTAKKISEMGHKAPISHTNWVTTDGITNWIEPRNYDLYTESVEDWKEIDFKHINYTQWEAGGFYNQHAYPYYPELLTGKQFIGDDDPFLEYLKRLKTHYNDLPFIITEMGLSTSIGVASRDPNYGRNHGGVSEIDQGRLMKELMLKIMNEIDIYGISVFQLHDEWFKKSWNTKPYEQIERQSWLNVLSAEQGFGIFSTRPDETKLKYEYIESDGALKKLSLSADPAYLHIKIKKDKIIDNYGHIIIGIDSWEDIGTYRASNHIRKIFHNEIETIIDIDVEHNKASLKQLRGCSTFVRNYAEWLSTSEAPGYKVEYCEVECVLDEEGNAKGDCYGCFQDIFNMQPDEGTFDDWKMLVRAPGFMYPGRNETNQYEDRYTYTNDVLTKIENVVGLSDLIFNETKQQLIYVPHSTYTFKFSEENGTYIYDNENLEYTVKIPWNIIGYVIPGYNKQFKLPIDTGRKFKLPDYELLDDESKGVKVEASLLVAGTNIPSTEIRTEYKWKGWEKPNHYCIKAKKGFRDYRSAFHQINGYVETEITDEDIEELSECYYNEDEINSHVSIHRLIVLISFIFLVTVFFLGAFGGLIVKHICYCYSFQKSDLELDEGNSYRLRIINFILLLVLFGIIYIDFQVSASELTGLYIVYVIMIIWDALLIFLGMAIYSWNLYEKKEIPEYDTKEHAFIISCHNSSDVVVNTLKSLLTRVSPETIFIGDNGSTKEEQQKCNKICYDLSKEWYKNNNLPFNDNKIINYGHTPMGNKTIAQYSALCNLPDYVKYVTCIDDDTRLHETWNVQKVIHYFIDESIVVLAYPLKAEKPEYDIELFQAIEYIVAGFTKIWHSKIRSTIFNSGAFGTYRVEILNEAFQYHNTDFNGDDLQICLTIHQLKGKKYITQEDKVHNNDYRVVAATDMIVSTIVPKCFLHLKSISSILFKNSADCTCDNPDLFKQRSKGWFVSKHRFIPKYIKLIFNCKGFKGIWVRLVALYELVIILNEYFVIFYIVLFATNYGLWMLEAFLIGISFNIFAMLVFNQFVLKKNKLGIPMEAITTQPLIYKIFMITIYRYCGLFYNLFYYMPTHRTGTEIRERIKEESFLESIKDMYVKREIVENNSSHIIEIPEEVD